MEADESPEVSHPAGDPEERTLAFQAKSKGRKSPMSPLMAARQAGVRDACRRVSPVVPLKEAELVSRQEEAEKGGDQDHQPRCNPSYCRGLG